MTQPHQGHQMMAIENWKCREYKDRENRGRLNQLNLFPGECQNEAFCTAARLL